ADLLRALTDAVSHDAIDAHRREEQREQAERRTRVRGEARQVEGVGQVVITDTRHLHGYAGVEVLDFDPRLLDDAWQRGGRRCADQEAAPRVDRVPKVGRHLGQKEVRRGIFGQRYVPPVLRDADDLEQGRVGAAHADALPDGRWLVVEHSARERAIED